MCDYVGDGHDFQAGILREAFLFKFDQSRLTRLLVVRPEIHCLHWEAQDVGRYSQRLIHCQMVASGLRDNHCTNYEMENLSITRQIFVISLLQNYSSLNT